MKIDIKLTVISIKFLKFICKKYIKNGTLIIKREKRRARFMPNSLLLLNPNALTQKEILKRNKISDNGLMNLRKFKPLTTAKIKNETKGAAQ